MNRYLEELEFLYQKISLQEADRQLEIAETGADVGEAGLDREPAPDEQPPMEDPDMNNAAYNDAAYMNDQDQGDVEQSGEQDVAIDEISRNRKLFALYNELLTYATYFLDNVSNLQLDMLEKEDVKKILTNIYDIKQTIQKLKDYTLFQYSKYPYHRNLYTYILLRTELMTEVKIIRDLMSNQEK